MTPRRFYLLKRLAARERRDPLEETWLAKQLIEEGEPLRGDFPFRAQLVAAGYHTVEDLTGADVAELWKHANLLGRDAQAVLAALTA